MGFTSSSKVRRRLGFAFSFRLYVRADFAMLLPTWAMLLIPVMIGGVFFGSLCIILDGWFATWIEDKFTREFLAVWKRTIAHCSCSIAT